MPYRYFVLNYVLYYQHDEKTDSFIRLCTCDAKKSQFGPGPTPAPTLLFVATPLLFELFLFHEYLYLVMLLLFSVPFFYLDA